jgi:YidC/Oxa1 family membrane protein insertase
VIVYWVTQNLFSLGQQFWVLHKYPPPIAAGNTPMRQPKPATTKPAAVNGAKPAATGGLGAVASRARSAFLSPSADTKPTRTGVFRKRTPEPEPVVETRAGAPKVGAKPINPRTKSSAPNGTITVEATAPKSTAANGNGANGSNNAGAASGNGTSGSGTSGNGTSGNGASGNGAKVTPAKVTPTKMSPAKVAAASATTPAKATTATRATPAKAPAKSQGTKATPAKSTQGKKSGSKRH